MTIPEIVAYLGAFVALMSVVMSAITTRNSASKEELRGLRETIVTLQTENGRLRVRMTEYELSDAAKNKTIAAQDAEIERLRDELAEVRAQLDNMAKRKTGKLG